MKTININWSLTQIRRTATILVLSTGLLFGLQSCKKDEGEPAKTNTSVQNSANYKALNNTMHKLWNDHMQWTYATVDAFFHNEAGLQGQLNRLLKNQRDIGDAIVPYYGQAAGDQLATLLTEHINGAVPVLQAAKAGDEGALNTALEAWYKNAQDVADFLASANANWPQSEMREMMKMHIDQTTTYAVHLLNNDYDKAIEVFEEANMHMIMMADMLSEGIAKQFPGKF